MGNKNARHLNRTKSNRNNQFDRFQNESTTAIDFDEIAQEWFWSFWQRTKSKKYRHFKRDELQVNLNWERTMFNASAPQYYNGSLKHLPNSQVLYRTNFCNRTFTDQSYTFNAERRTKSTFRYSFRNSLIKAKQTKLTFRLPDELAEFTAGIQREQTIELEQSVENEIEMCWSVKNQVEVAPFTSAHAELTIDEIDYRGEFSIPIEIYGRLAATITKKLDPTVPLAFLDCDIAKLCYEFVRPKADLVQMKIIEGDVPIVQFELRGECAFRHGIEQHFKLSQEKLDLPTITLKDQTLITSDTKRYRLVQTRFMSPSLNNLDQNE